jgi:ribonucleoside-diphosphate reductase alpha chain
MGSPTTSSFLDRISWVPRTAAIPDDSGEAIFVQEEVEAPEHWSDSAVGIVASRYFGGRPGSPERETSVRALLARVGGTLARWVGDQGLGDRGAVGERLLEMLVRQRAAFNSPVWFNVGVDEKPQCSACFILSVEDDLRSILELARIEGLIFKRGSGSGTNLSRLRSSREPLQAGGTASGPVSFMRGYDAFAGVVKSGGRTRRAAKMQILDAGHPDILAFVQAKAVEERKAKALTAAGFSGGLDGEAYHSVAFQNSNLSVRANDAFLHAVEEDLKWTTHAVTTGEPEDTFPAKLLMRRIAEGAWECGDPGLQYEDTIHAWHTCPASGRIAASNPCSEFLFLDDTACNLASLNLLAYLDEEGTFAARRFREDVELLITTMEAIVDRSSYPTPLIAGNSRRFRPLGLGYANLGALVMSLGLPYDSAVARGWGASLTALLAGEAYRVSARLAERLGPFEGFEENREPFLEVLERHRASLDEIAEAPERILGAARRVWEEAIETARRHGVRNAQTSLLAPTGTIALLMDCDTTGIEPDLALVKYKRLAGGGTLRLVNRCVPRALRMLGYADAAVEAIVSHIEHEETIEGAPDLSEEHLPVFDCAFRPPAGERAIRPEGHINMVAAIQPFLSGGISKTLNLPEEATVEEIERLFLLAWKLKVKSLAVFREKSKGVQPLGTHCVIDRTGDGCCG